MTNSSDDHFERLLGDDAATLNDETVLPPEFVMSYLNAYAVLVAQGVFSREDFTIRGLLKWITDPSVTLRYERFAHEESIVIRYGEPTPTTIFLKEVLRQPRRASDPAYKPAFRVTFTHKKGFYVVVKFFDFPGDPQAYSMKIFPTRCVYEETRSRWNTTHVLNKHERSTSTCATS
jgi:hypothetical protein